MARVIDPETGEDARYCVNCGVDMMPPDDVWIVCFNARDLCVDCGD